jgi:hypothetical protein
MSAPAEKKTPQKKTENPGKDKKNGKAMGAMRTLVILDLSCGGTGKFPLSWWILPVCWHRASGLRVYSYE